MPEPRRHLAVPLPVQVRRADGSWEQEYALNLSAGGVCLHARRPIPPGESVRLAFELPSSGRKVEVEARVVWVTCESERAPGSRFCELGLAFLSLEPEEAEALRSFAVTWSSPACA